MTDAAPVVEWAAVTKGIPGQPRLLDGIDLRVSAGEAISILGRSGSGKTTLLSVIGMLALPDSGSYRFLGEEVTTLSSAARDRLRAQHVGFVFQRFSLFPTLSALENVIAPLRHSGRAAERERRRAATEALESVGMAGGDHKRPHQLSGGEQQRVAIARALIRRPQLLVADEPTGSLDEQTGASMIDLLLDRVHNDGASLIVVTHDSEVAARVGGSLHLAGGALTDTVT